MKTIRLISLGCPKNLVDSEVMLGKLSHAGYKIVPDSAPADIFIVNTCSFIKDATDESENIIKQAIKLKKSGHYGKIAVVGCLPQRQGKKVSNVYSKDIDAWIGVFNRDNIAELCDSLLEDEKPEKCFIPPAISSTRHDTERLMITPPHFAYLRIAEGCNNRCTYCVIPNLHGAYRSKPVDDVIKEAQILADNGVKELNIIAQDTTSYGIDIHGKPQLAYLLRKLSKIEKIKWIRLLYTHPRYFTDELVNEISCNDKIVKYIDLPIQHISDNILGRMNRKTSSAEIRNLLDKLRSSIKGLFIRTTFIVGFPGETQKDFDELLDFLVKTRFERLGAFKYSSEKGTVAYSFGNKVSETVSRKRLDIIMRAQQKIAFEFNKSLKGEIISTIIDEEKGKRYLGRTYGDAPEVDGNIFIRGKGLKQGGIYKVKITGNKGYDLIGEKI
jgi:ribosomal protein S12 methylthiotransferase